MLMLMLKEKWMLIRSKQNWNTKKALLIVNKRSHTVPASGRMPVESRPN